MHQRFRRLVGGDAIVPMKTFLSILVTLFLVGTVPQLEAAPPKPKIPAKVVYIAIKSIDTTAMTITVEPRNSMSTEAKT